MRVATLSGPLLVGRRTIKGLRTGVVVTVAVAVSDRASAAVVEIGEVKIGVGVSSTEASG
jgi:hypothetical protein